MNSITTALRNAGIHVPMTKRVWQWLHDHKLPATSTDVASELHIDKTNAAGVLYELYTRDMITRAVMPTPGARGRTYTYTAKGRTYELLPKRKVAVLTDATRFVARIGGGGDSGMVQPIPVPPPPPPVAPIFDAKKFTDSLCVSDAKKLYEYLRVFFTS